MSVPILQSTSGAGERSRPRPRSERCPSESAPSHSLVPARVALLPCTSCSPLTLRSTSSRTSARRSSHARRRAWTRQPCRFLRSCSMGGAPLCRARRLRRWQMRASLVSRRSRLSQCCARAACTTRLARASSSPSVCNRSGASTAATPRWQRSPTARRCSQSCAPHRRSRARPRRAPPPRPAMPASQSLTTGRPAASRLRPCRRALTLTRGASTSRRRRPRQTCSRPPSSSSTARPPRSLRCVRSGRASDEAPCARHDRAAACAAAQPVARSAGGAARDTRLPAVGRGRGGRLRQLATGAAGRLHGQRRR
mmetsp:Transcript_79037/g.191134  ORF Transcript_79037/g.191134 Transcript_79037/m.191134 type:complete len:310 (-) Transcript_79037:981-1910(-)